MQVSQTQKLSLTTRQEIKLWPDTTQDFFLDLFRIPHLIQSKDSFKFLSNFESLSINPSVDRALNSCKLSSLTSLSGFTLNPKPLWDTTLKVLFK